ncbi:MAG: Omp28-related outer membrane protein [Bacteroidia bacterium]|nr:Omp28-related outer membrane protein [Bacteroidia bacterium]
MSEYKTCVGKYLGTICLLFSLTSNITAQLPVDTILQNKKAVIEEFTGIYCGACPNGHAVLSTIHHNDPNNVVLISIHEGYFAEPEVPLVPDFRTQDGDSIALIPGMRATNGVATYPSASVNRMIFNGSIMSMPAYSWSAAVNSVKTQTAYCNVALQATLDVQTRVLNVHTQVYYTANSPSSTNFLTIALLEDSVPGPQHDYGNYNPTNWFPDGSYKHNDVLRDIITPAWGQPISPTSAGTKLNIYHTYTVPLTFPSGGTNTTSCLPGRLKLVAFVAETYSTIINGAYGPIYLNNFSYNEDIGITNLKCNDEVCSGIMKPIEFWFVNNGNYNVAQVSFTYSGNNLSPGQFTWNGNCPPYTQKFVSINNVSIVPTVNSNTFQIGVASINSNSDENPVNDQITKIVQTTTLVAPSINMQMNFNQDQYGWDTRWKIIEDVTGLIVVQDGPWNNLNSSGTLLHTKTFTLQPNTCYRLEITDEYGDGACCNYGNGSYDLKSGGTSIFSGLANYGFGLTKWFKTGNDVSVDEHNILPENIIVYPNPINEKMKIEFLSNNHDNMRVSMFDVIGQMVYSQNIPSDRNIIEVDCSQLPQGMYFVYLVNNSDKLLVKKICIIH